MTDSSESGRYPGRELAAYNARDLEAFVASFDPAIEVHDDVSLDPSSAAPIDAPAVRFATAVRSASCRECSCRPMRHLVRFAR
jgi:hypothetical protein